MERQPLLWQPLFVLTGDLRGRFDRPPVWGGSQTQPPLFAAMAAAVPGYVARCKIFFDFSFCMLCDVMSYYVMLYCMLCSVIPCYGAQCNILFWFFLAMTIDGAAAIVVAAIVCVDRWSERGVWSALSFEAQKFQNVSKHSISLRCWSVIGALVYEKI